MAVAVPLLDPAPPLVLLPALEVSFEKGAPPPIGEVPLLEPAPEVEFDPTRGPPVVPAAVEVGTKVLVKVDPEASVAVTTAPGKTPAEPLSAVEVAVVLGPVTTTTVFAPVVAVEVVAPELPLATTTSTVSS